MPVSEKWMWSHDSLPLRNSDSISIKRLFKALLRIKSCRDILSVLLSSLSSDVVAVCAPSAQSDICQPGAQPPQPFHTLLPAVTVTSLHQPITRGKLITAKAYRTGLVQSGVSSTASMKSPDLWGPQVWVLTESHDMILETWQVGLLFTAIKALLRFCSTR